MTDARESLDCLLTVRSGTLDPSSLCVAFAAAMGGHVETDTRGARLVHDVIDCEVRAREDGALAAQITPRPGILRARYVMTIAFLLERLWAAGEDASASCTFAEELPRFGGSLE